MGIRFVALCCWLAACDRASTEPALAENPAYIYLESSSTPLVSVEAPPHAGQAFQLTLNTYGADGCWTFGRTELDTSASPLVITPYNRYAGGPNVGCTLALARIPHTLTLTFATSGTKTVIIQGREFSGRIIREPVTITVLP